ncbi:MAG: 4-alpha-glucanotransferase [Candidatus Promineifilaceae bacterium]|nr:4-alpha-glucanotransferase [Candidatus Promineifilaceae bacterium]
MRFPRSAGVLAHPTSFPGRYGIGDIGGAAYNFIDFLVKSRQSLWQILPLGPTGYGDSPYQSFSAFAGNPLLISPDKLVQDGYLSAAALEDVPRFPRDKVDFGWVIDYKGKLLKQAFDQFQHYGLGDQRVEFEAFCAEQASWLDDYALFMALKNFHVEHEGGVWNTWPEDIARHQPQAVAWWAEHLETEVKMQKFMQYLFFDQWLALKAYANERGIKVVGDIPIFVAFDSADVWANPDLFYLNEDGSPAVVAGVPPDYFSATGQRWGNPLYRWYEMSQNNYAWWTARLEMSFTQADIVRIDHFRGFDAYWEIPASEPTAVIGKWIKGPGQAFFEAMEQNLDELPLIAEDLGVITPEVVALRDRFDFPGMKILQFAFGGERNSGFLPHNFDSNCVVYTGTHDNETVCGWFGNASEDERRHVLSYMDVSSGDNIAWDLIRLAYASVADTAVSTLQDLMDLDNRARMNFPGKPSGNWQWRYEAPMLTDEIAQKLAALTELYGRVR